MSYKLITSWDKSGDTSLIKLDIYSKKSVDKSNVSLSDFNASKNIKKLKPNTPVVSTSSPIKLTEPATTSISQQKINSVKKSKYTLKFSLTFIMAISVLSILSFAIFPSVLNLSNEEQLNETEEKTPVEHKNNILDQKHSIDDYKKSLKSLEDLK